MKTKASKSRGKGKRARKTPIPAGTPKARLYHLLARKKGVPLQLAAKTLGWAPHTVRGRISDLSRKHGVKVVSSRDGKRGRVYRVAA